MMLNIYKLILLIEKFFVIFYFLSFYCKIFDFYRFFMLCMLLEG